MTDSPAEFTVGSGASESLQNFCTAFEPYGLKPNTSLRKTGFGIADTNGTGQASLAEIENFIISSLQNAFEDDSVSEELFDMYRPSYRHAFNNAKKLRGSNGKKTSSSSSSDDYVSYAEFRVFTIYLRIYASMFDIFCNVDGGEARDANDDSRIELEEFLNYSSSLSGYNFIALKGISTPEDTTELFHRIDTGGSGKLIFSEWSTFLKSWEIKANTSMGILLSGKLKPTRLGTAQGSRTTASVRTGNTGRSGGSVAQSTTPTRKAFKTSVSTPTSRPSPKSRTSNGLPMKVSGAYIPSKSASNDLKDFVFAFQPLAEKTSKGTLIRKKVFSACDGNGTGQCSLAEIDSFVQSRLKLELGMKRSKTVFKRFRSSYIRAFNAAKDISKSSEDYITFAEFRLLNAYLCIFVGLYDIFSKLDGGGEGITEDDDRRITEKEFVEGYRYFKDSGFSSLSKIKSTSNAKAVFATMDSDQQGKVLLIEFCDYVQVMEVRAGTAIGKLFDVRPSSRGSRVSAYSAQRSAPQDILRRSNSKSTSSRNRVNPPLPPTIKKKESGFDDGVSYDEDDDAEEMDLGPTAAKNEEVTEELPAAEAEVENNEAPVDDNPPADVVDVVDSEVEVPVEEDNASADNEPIDTPNETPEVENVVDVEPEVEVADAYPSETPVDENDGDAEPEVEEAEPEVEEAEPEVEEAEPEVEEAEPEVEEAEPEVEEADTETPSETPADKNDGDVEAVAPVGEADTNTGAEPIDEDIDTEAASDSPIDVDAKLDDEGDVADVQLETPVNDGNDEVRDAESPVADVDNQLVLELNEEVKENEPEVEATVTKSPLPEVETTDLLNFDN